MAAQQLAGFLGSASSGSGGNVLFNFAQFGQKLPRSQSNTRLNQNLYGLGLDPGLDGDLLYDHSDDGDLMQLLFGVPDELPTMATIHLHKWSNADGDEEDGAGPEEHARGEAPARPASGTASGAAATGPGGQQGSVGAERSGGQASTAAAAGPAASQQPTPLPQQSPHEGAHAPGMNGKLIAPGGTEAPAPEAYPGLNGSGGGGKAALGQLVNGMANAHHATDEHHRDHLLDAETFRLLHSCD
ncbi:hypothetical protein GPECTOR_102g44 [Gonium pectorale]|uniref:Uncharacterized protein n=1 Tax=Gonium pectorale TaxID=33097 RepID=A0A150FZU0_GONPE|nr:hypothetical protein GPECTOR_102g44 [Gonium pectorale]|eukprot:KXZ43091.1 hypothetical protein GPECTOR_102g44 [Gonium pectorale]